MSTLGILQEYADRQGWDDWSMLVLLCQYVDNQASPDVLEDFLAQQVDLENAAGSSAVEGDLVREDVDLTTQPRQVRAWVLTGDIIHPGRACVEAGSLEEAIAQAEDGDFEVFSEQEDCLAFTFCGDTDGGVELDDDCLAR